MPEDTIFLSLSDSSIDEPLVINSNRNDNDYMNIVLATDKTYFYPMLCVIKSACANKLPSTKYQFTLLVDDDFTKDHERLVNSILRKYDLPSARIHNSASEYLDVHYAADHLSSASCYRLQIPTLFKRMKKCIYLDCDTLVRKDLTGLYDALKEEDLLVGILAAAYQENPSNAKAKAEVLGLPNIDTYVNAGVLVMNLDLMREMSLQEVFDGMMQRNFPDIDQDILNTACFGNVRTVSPTYNAMTKYSFEEDAFEKDNAIRKCWAKDEWEEARTDPAIVHFADTDKPWTNFALPFAKEWWDYIDEMGLTEKVFKFFYDLHAYRQQSVYEMRKLANETKAELKKANRENADLTLLIEDQTATINRLKNRIANKNERIAILKERLGTQREKTIEARNRAKSANSKLKKLRASKSYKIGRAITKPYRSLKETPKDNPKE